MSLTSLSKIPLRFMVLDLGNPKAEDKRDSDLSVIQVRPIKRNDFSIDYFKGFNYQDLCPYPFNFLVLFDKH